MTKQEFKNAFAVTFLASYAATHYTETCMMGNHVKFDNMPIEDASFLAESAWNQAVNLGLVKTEEDGKDKEG